MRHGYLMRLFVSVLLALGISALVPSNALVSPIEVIDDGAVSKGTDLAAAAGVCVLEPEGPRSGQVVAFTPPESYTALATLVTPASCFACPAPTLLTLNSVSIRLRWQSACSATAEVSVVGVKGAPGCLEPDLANVLCAPVSHTIASGGVTFGGVQHTLAFPPGCCITGPAFVLVKFIGLAACGGVGLYLGGTQPCPPCTQYVSSTSFYPTLTEICSALQLNLWVSVDADCCDPSPTLPSNWGRLKALYR